MELALDIAARNAAGPVAKKNIRQTEILYDRETATAMCIRDRGNTIAAQNTTYAAWIGENRPQLLQLADQYIVQ